MTLVLDDRIRKARREHMCDSCLRPISAGTTYRRVRCVNGGDAWTWKAHPACERAGKLLYAAGIEGDDGAYLNVCEMDSDEREAVYAADPDTYHEIWPDRPAPRQPAR